MIREDHFVRISQRKQEQIIAYSTERARVVLVAHHPVCDAFTLFVFKCLDEREIIFLFAIRASVIRPLVPLFADLRLWNKLDNLDIARRRWVKFLEILLSENHVSARLDLVAFLNLFGGHFLTRIRIDHVLLHTFLLSIVEHMKTYR